jgi:hypothetical protein
MGENLFNDRRVFNAGDDPHCPATGRAGLDIDAEDPFQALSTGHRGAPFARCRLLPIPRRGMLASPAPLGRRHPRAVFAVRRKHPVETGEIESRLGHQGRQPGDEVEGFEDDMGRAIAVRRL